MIGMLWYDNSKDPLSMKIERAVKYYHEKYGKRPNLAYVNPSTTIDECIIEIKTTKQVLPNHIWIGKEE